MSGLRRGKPAQAGCASASWGGERVCDRGCGRGREPADASWTTAAAHRTQHLQIPPLDYQHLRWLAASSCCCPGHRMKRIEVQYSTAALQHQNSGAALQSSMSVTRVTNDPSWVDLMRMMILQQNTAVQHENMRWIAV